MSEYFDNFLDSIIEILYEENDIELDLNDKDIENLICSCFNNNLSVNQTIIILINKFNNELK